MSPLQRYGRGMRRAAVVVAAALATLVLSQSSALAITNGIPLPSPYGANCQGKSGIVGNAPRQATGITSCDNWIGYYEYPNAPLTFTTTVQAQQVRNGSWVTVNSNSVTRTVYIYGSETVVQATFPRCPAGVTQARVRTVHTMTNHYGSTRAVTTLGVACQY